MDSILDHSSLLLHTLLWNVMLLSITFFLHILSFTAAIPMVSNRTLHSSSTKKKPLMTHYTEFSSQNGYFGIDLEIGMPPQTVKLLLDTGSADSWVMGNSNPFCADASEFPRGERLGDIPQNVAKDPELFGKLPCNSYGIFDTSLSSSFQDTGEKYDLGYRDETFVKGRWVQDIITIGDVTMDYKFGIGEYSNTYMGTFAVGIPDHEIDSHGHVQYTKNSWIMKLRSKLKIGSNTFSIYMSSQEKNKGTLLFGGVDKAKYEPPLRSLKFINTERPGSPIRKYEVMLKNIFLTNITKPSDLEHGHEQEDAVIHDIFDRISYNKRYIGALLDTGSTMSYFPQKLVDSLLSFFEYKYKLPKTDQYLVECNAFSSIKFEFSNAIVDIPLKNFLFKRTIDSTTRFPDKSPGGKEFCILGILPQASDSTILGQAFFRGTYTVFDLDNMQLSIASAKFTNASDIEEISISMPLDSIPDTHVDLELIPVVNDPRIAFIQNFSSNHYYSMVNGCGAQNASRRLACYFICLVLFFVL